MSLQPLTNLQSYALNWSIQFAESCLLCHKFCCHLQPW
uniref:Uncharacterized protein n=1 Tax=Rhizophora mucronata TaxID=61149 RepID=A0A2P2NT37_RHIMU